MTPSLSTLGEPLKNRIQNTDSQLPSPNPLSYPLLHRSHKAQPPFSNRIPTFNQPTVTMAIYPTTNPSAQENPSSSTAAINIEAWTEEATRSLQALSISSLSPAPLRSAGLRATSVSLAIPLDEPTTPARQPPQTNRAPIADPATYRPRREPLRRDSLKRREALLKGKEGSRRRQRWENGQ